MARKVSVGPSVAPLLIVALVAVVAVSGMFAMSSGRFSVGKGVTGAQVAQEVSANENGADDTAVSSSDDDAWGDQEYLDEAALAVEDWQNYGSNKAGQCKRGVEGPEAGFGNYKVTWSAAKGGEFDAYGNRGPFETCLYKLDPLPTQEPATDTDTTPDTDATPSESEPSSEEPAEELSDNDECSAAESETESPTGKALSIGGKGTANWMILGTALLAVVLLGVLVKSRPAKNKKANKTRALVLTGILALAIVAGGLVLLKPVTRGHADDSGTSGSVQVIVNIGVPDDLIEGGFQAFADLYQSSQGISTQQQGIAFTNEFRKITDYVGSNFLKKGTEKKEGKVQLSITGEDNVKSVSRDIQTAGNTMRLECMQKPNNRPLLVIGISEHGATPNTHSGILWTQYAKWIYDSIPPCARVVLVSGACHSGALADALRNEAARRKKQGQEIPTVKLLYAASVDETASPLGNGKTEMGPLVEFARVFVSNSQKGAYSQESLNLARQAFVNALEDSEGGGHTIIE